MASKLQYPREKLIYTSCISLFIGLICSKFLLTLSMISLVVLGLLSPTVKQDWKRLWTNKSFAATLGIFLLFLGSALMSDNWSASMVRLRIALPMLLLPIAFALLPTFSKKSYQQLLSIYFYLMVIACLGVLINYGLHYEEMQQLLIVSKAIPTPNGEHIRFSLMINLAVFAGFWLLQEQFYFYNEVFYCAFALFCFSNCSPLLHWCCFFQLAALYCKKKIKTSIIQNLKYRLFF